MALLYKSRLLYMHIRETSWSVTRATSVLCQLREQRLRKAAQDVDIAFTTWLWHLDRLQLARRLVCLRGHDDNDDSGTQQDSFGKLVST